MAPDRNSGTPEPGESTLPTTSVHVNYQKSWIEPHNVAEAMCIIGQNRL